MTNPRDIRSDGSSYPVLEMFTSVQSEGARAGTLTQFLRLGGCNMKCPFCDTPMEPYQMMTPAEIGRLLRALESGTPTGWQLVITGGEPLVHNLMPLFEELGRPTQTDGFFIAMESNGSCLHHLHNNSPETLRRIDWLTVSPKTWIPPWLLREYAKEVKYVVPDHEKLIDWQHSRVFVQPEFGNPEAVQRCMYWMSCFPVIRLSLQTHKFIGLR